MLQFAASQLGEDRSAVKKKTNEDQDVEACGRPKTFGLTLDVRERGICSIRENFAKRIQSVFFILDRNYEIVFYIVLNRNNQEVKYCKKTHL